ncbi:MAG TPA: hypothetical protein PL110_07655 [Candidatus Eremiobacteraeota bacterium]|nr:MAG: hypothetical protein BWY64_00240 [bacterium ADurb.Bin363]HPZ07972.1 hypothetical protein [Candidatus Eremiobacteraeota bacterium]
MELVNQRNADLAYVANMKAYAKQLAEAREELAKVKEEKSH